MLTNVFRKIVALPVWAKAMLLLAPTLVLVLVGLALILSLASPPVLSWAWLIGIGGVIALIMLWRIPAWQVRNLTVDNNEDEHKKFELKNEARKTIAQIFGGFFLLMGFFFTAKQLYVAQEAQTVAREAQLNSQAAQITERFDRATKQLTSDSMEIRVGGMYAFKRIANDSEKDLGSVVEILQTFVRENAPRNKAKEEYPGKPLYRDPNGFIISEGPADVDAAVTALVDLSRGRNNPISLYLPGTNLEGMSFTNGNFHGTYLYNSNLQYAGFLGGDLPEAEFFDSNLRSANLWGGRSTIPVFAPRLY